MKKLCFLCLQISKRLNYGTKQMKVHQEGTGKLLSEIRSFIMRIWNQKAMILIIVCIKSNRIGANISNEEESQEGNI